MGAHMAWSSSNRRASLPSDWKHLRAKILKRDPLCQLAYDCCAGASQEVDHIGAADDHRPMMLRGVCVPCHKRRTQEQAQAARPTRARPQERHPGVIA